MLQNYKTLMYSLMYYLQNCFIRIPPHSSKYNALFILHGILERMFLLLAIITIIRVWSGSWSVFNTTVSLTLCCKHTRQAHHETVNSVHIGTINI